MNSNFLLLIFSYFQKTTAFSCPVCVMLQRDADELAETKENKRAIAIIVEQQTKHFALHR